VFGRQNKAVGPALVSAGLLFLAAAGSSRAGDDEAALRSLVEQQSKLIEAQNKQLEELKRRLDALGKAAGKKEDAKEEKKDDSKEDKKDDEKEGKAETEKINKAVSDYLKDHPGAGMPPGVQTGFAWGQGFYLRSARDPPYVKWDDESRIPFELRIRGRLDLDYYGYKVTDDVNHETGAHQQTQNANSNRFADFSQLEVKYLRLAFEGTAFDPNLRYRLELDGGTRGVAAVQNNKVVQTAGAFDPNTSGVSPIGGGVVVDNAVRLYQGWMAYDWHPCWGQKGCGPDGDCPYVPTVTFTAGKMRPFLGLEAFLGDGNEQFVEFSMAYWMFSLDDDNCQMAAGTQIWALDDRFFMQALVTNGNDSQFPNQQMDELPGFNLGFWYDFGGSWDPEHKRYNLFGDCLSDVDWSCKPVVRVGGGAGIVPMDRRSLYGDDEQSRVFVMPAGPGGTRLINLLNGDGSTTATSLRGVHAVDKFDQYTYNAFVAAKWRGFSLSNEWWVRDLNNFRSVPGGFDQILYTYTDPGTKNTVTALFPNKALLDFGMQLQGGYFIIPKKLELVARWAWVSGESGDVLGNGKPFAFDIPSGVAAPALKGGLERVQVNPGAFSNFHDANEYTVGINYYFKRHFLKWQTDFGFYTGGNPAAGGQPAAGFIPGEDGWLLRTQIQLWF
jgi:hypothetical protein